MRCLFCITELPVDSNTSHIQCPLCGTAFDVHEGQLMEASADVTDFNELKPFREDKETGI